MMLLKQKLFRGIYICLVWTETSVGCGYLAYLNFVPGQKRQFKFFEHPR